MFNLDDLRSSITRTAPDYPTADAILIPADVPEKIGKTFREALENIQRGYFETAILLCGKVLDLATKSMDQTWKLEKRLKALAGDGRITKDMADWAKEIRLDRNTAVHDEAHFTEDDAEDIAVFTEAFLTYIFTLPALVESRRNETSG